MKEIDHSIDKSVEEQIKEFSTGELIEQLFKENKELAELGVKTPISSIAHGAVICGFLYEDRRIPGANKVLKDTPMNYFMALVSSQPDLLKLPLDKFQKLGGAVSRIAMATDVLIGKEGPFRWPIELTENPQWQVPKTNIAKNIK